MVPRIGYYMYDAATLSITVPNNKPITVIHNKTPQFNDPLQLHCAIKPLLSDIDGFHGEH